MAVLVAFDFDQTIIDVNSDPVVRDAFGPIDKKQIAQKTEGRGWTCYMTEVFKVHHSNGIRRKDIFEVLDKIRIPTPMLTTLQGLKDLGAELIIISHANTVFIERILESHDIGELFDKVYTYPAQFTDDELLTLNFDPKGKDCRMCPLDLCKGKVMEEYVEQRRQSGTDFKLISFVGDGGNDFCPMSRLRKDDIAFPRVGEKYGIMRRIAREAENGLLLKANVIEWTSGEKILEAIQDRL